MTDHRPDADDRAVSQPVDPAAPLPAESEPSEDRRLLAQLAEAVEAGDNARLDALLEPLHAADIADIIEQLAPAARRAFLSLYSGEIDGEILTEIDESIREDVIDQLPVDVLADAVREMDSDDVVDLVEDLDAPEREKILSALDVSDRAAVEQSLNWPEYSAGRLMQSEVVVAPEHWTVGQAIDHLRGEDWLPDQFYHVILIDPRYHPTGYVTLGRLLSAARDKPLRLVAEDSFRAIRADEDEGEVARLFEKYHLISAPVVDDNDRLVGVITIDDAMSVLDEEHEEDILRLAGVGEDSSLADTVFGTLRQRVPWLAVNSVTALLSATVISMFSDSIAHLVALAVLMPIVASMGGNAGTQTLTVAVRGLATRDLTSSNVRRVVRRELAVGVLNGLVFALVMALVAWAWFDDLPLAGVIAVAMVLNLTVAALAGIVIPLALEKLGADPALASGTFVTTVTDVVGFLAFLGLATVFLLHGGMV